MKCPQCQAAMTQSKVGFLCPNCGHLETGASSADALAPQAAKSSSPTPEATKPAPTPKPEPKTPVVTPATSEKALEPKSPDPEPSADHQPPMKPSISAAPLRKSETTPAPIPALETAPSSAAAEPAAPPAATPPRTKPHKRHWIKWLLVAVAIIVFLTIAVLGYAFAARRPYEKFQQRLSNAKTLAYSGQLKFSAEGFLSSFGSDLAFDGHYDQTNATSPRGDLNFKGTWASQQYDGQAVLSDGTLFFKLGGPVLPVIRYNQSTFLYPITADWHKTKLDNSLYGNYCETRSDTKYPQALELYRLIRGIKANNSPLVNFFSNLNGQMATHYHGSVASNQIPELLTQFNAQLPPSCGLQYQPPTDTKQLTVSYDLWTGLTSDRVRLTFEDKSVGAKLSLTSDLKDYNQPAVITPPSTAIGLNAVRQNQLDLLVRDQTRKNDIDKLQTALTNFAAANKKLFPASLNALSPKYLQLIPTDPKSKQLYSYVSGSGRKSFKLLANLEEPNAGAYAVTGP